MRLRNKVVAAVALVCGLSSQLITFAIAQETEIPEETSVQLEEIIVTARKRDESLQDVPAAVTAFTTDQLIAAGIKDAIGLATVTPNLVFDQITAGSTGSSAISLRGVSFQDVEKSFDPAIGLQFDDVFMGTANGQIFDLLDVERIEVLRGPQGTLFGKNTIGGLINIVRSKPTGELGAKLRVGFGSDGEQRFDGLLNVGNEKFAAKFVVGSYETDGFFTDQVSGEDVGAADAFTGTANFLWNISESTSIDYAFTAMRDDGDTPPLLNTSGAGSILTCILAGQCAPDSNTPQTGDRYVVAQDGSNENFFDSDTHRIKVQSEINDNLSFTYIGARQETDEVQNQDFDATIVPIFQARRDQQYEQTSHELRVNGNYGGINFVAGLFLWDSEYQLEQTTEVFGAPSTTNADHEVESQSIFIEGDFSISDNLTATVGARYIDEEKTFGATDNILFSTLADPSNESWSDTIYRTALKYDFNDNVQGYVSYSTGFRSGGFNGRAGSLNVARESYEPEEVENLEFGVKSSLLNNRMTLNVALFAADYNDKQEEIAISDPSSATGQSTVVRNAATAEVSGLEFEINYQVTEAFRLGIYGGLLDSDYVDFTADIGLGDGVQDRSNLILRRAPESNLGLTSSYTFQLGKGIVRASLNYAWKDDYNIIFTNDAEGQIDSFGTLNGVLSYELENMSFRITGRNLTEEEHYSHSFVVAPNIVGGNLFAFASPVAPRTVSAEFTYEF